MITGVLLPTPSSKAITLSLYACGQNPHIGYSPDTSHRLEQKNYHTANSLSLVRRKQDNRE